MPTFTTNWATKHFANWEKWLKPLMPVYSTEDGKSKALYTPRRVLEIGCFEGQATLWFVENLCKHPDSYVVCVDPHSYEGQPIPPDEAAKWLSQDHEGIQRRFRENTEPVADKVHYYNKQSSEFFQGGVYYLEEVYGLDLPFDLIYIDGNHIASCVLEDSVHAWQYLAEGGYLLWDDYRWRGKTSHLRDRPRLAIDSFLRCYEGRYEFINPRPPYRHNGQQPPPKQVCIRKTTR